MKAELRGIECVDIPQWRKFVPADPSDVLVWFALSIGSVGGKGADLFQLAVATRNGIRERRVKTKFVGMVLDPFDAAMVEPMIRRWLETIEGKDWEDVTKKIDALAEWEYRDYRS